MPKSNFIITDKLNRTIKSQVSGAYTRKVWQTAAFEVFSKLDLSMRKAAMDKVLKDELSAKIDAIDFDKLIGGSK